MQRSNLFLFFVVRHIVSWANEAYSLADNRPETENKEGAHESGEGKGEEKQGQLVARVLHDPNHSFVNTDNDANADDSSDEFLGPVGVDPEERLNVAQAVALAEDHAEEDKEERSVVKGLVQPDPVVRRTQVLLLAIFFLLIRVEDPSLRHVPGALECKIEDNLANKQEDGDEEHLELLLSRRLQDEACFHAELVDFIIEVNGDDKEHNAVELAHKHLVHVVHSVGDG